MIELIWLEDSEEKSRIAGVILQQLPQWFGILEAIDWYVEASQHLPMLVAYANQTPVGFLCLDETSSQTMEIIVMGILPQFHRQGIGRQLILEAQAWLKVQSYTYLQVKTLADSHPDVNYALTRHFYHSMGFVDVEVFEKLWGTENPALQMILKV